MRWKRPHGTPAKHHFQCCACPLSEGSHALLVHRYDSAARWQPTSFARWARAGSDKPLTYDLPFAAPEVGAVLPPAACTCLL